MKQTKMLWAAVAVLMLGAIAPGCFPVNDDSLGRLCAAPTNGDGTCVSDDRNPADAWGGAKSKGKALVNGGMPIQMWAESPSSESLDQLVESRDKLNAWFTDIDKVLSYVRDTEKNAESYEASMSGNVGSMLVEAMGRQAERIAQKPVDAIGNFTQAMSDKANAEKGPLLATIAADKQSMTTVQAIFDQAKNDVAPLSAQFASLATQFAAYRATEAAETATYATLAAQASRSTLATIADAEQAILAAAHDASGKPNDLAMSAMTLSAQLQEFERSHQAAMAPQRDFLATHGAVLPDMTSGALRSLNAMLGYMQQRVARSDATATSLLSGVAMRRQALVLLEGGQTARDTVAKARLLKASTTFKEEASARVAALSKAPTTSTTMKLPYLSDRYNQLTAFMQMQPLCDPSSSSWREAGCTSLRANFSVAQRYLETTLPALITVGVSTMRSNGVDAALLNAVHAKLSVGDIKGAAIAYDAAVQSSEGT